MRSVFVRTPTSSRCITTSNKERHFRIDPHPSLLPQGEGIKSAWRYQQGFDRRRSDFPLPLGEGEGEGVFKRSKNMKKINIKDIPEESWNSPKGKFGGGSKGLSEALGRKPFSTDLKSGIRSMWSLPESRRAKLPFHITPTARNGSSIMWSRAKASCDTRKGQRQSKPVMRLSSSRKNRIL